MTENKVAQMRHPEQHVLDTIDALVTERLEGGEPLTGRVARCPLCHLDWHGLPRPGCIGGFHHRTGTEPLGGRPTAKSECDPVRRTYNAIAAIRNMVDSLISGAL